MQRVGTRLLWCSWALITALVLLMHLFGQRWFVVGALVYCPPQMWLCGLALIVMLAWRWSGRLAWINVATALIFAGPLWEYRTHRAPVKPELWSDPNTIRVLTVNRGDHHGHSTAPFILSQKPDLIAIQDSVMAQAYVPDAPEYANLPNRSRMGEFTLLSRFPIIKTELLMTKLAPGARGPTVLLKAARFEIDFHGRHIAIYNSHLPSPRRDLHLMGHTPSLTSLYGLRRYWLDHATIIDDIASRMEAEMMPVISLGDWNQPPIGPGYRHLVSKLQDAHTQAGLGYGWSFPGDWWTPFTAGNVWLRLDLVLCSYDWRVLHCEVEPEAESQHSAVSAVLHLR